MQSFDGMQFRAAVGEGQKKRDSTLEDKREVQGSVKAQWHLVDVVGREKGSCRGFSVAHDPFTLIHPAR